MSAENAKNSNLKPGERQPDEVLREKAREMFTQKYWVESEARVWTGTNVIEFAAAFAQSIQAEARQQIAKAHALAAQSHSQWLLMMDEKATFSAEEIVNRFKHWWDATERAEKAEQQLAEARAQLDAFSKGYKHRDGGPVSDACGEGRHAECTQAFPKCHCTFRWGHTTLHPYMNPVIKEEIK